MTPHSSAPNHPDMSWFSHTKLDDFVERIFASFKV
jgi:hypothetical protein